MIKILLKKQLLELYKNFFISKNTGKKRTLLGSSLWIIGFLCLLLLVSGMFTIYALNIYNTLSIVNMIWLYFVIVGIMSIALGILGSVFNTYSFLYKSKDNDLLLSMPIKTIHILISKIICVYLIGLMYTSVIMLPSLIIYYVLSTQTFISVITSLVFYLIISLIVLILSCILGYFVALISLLLKNRSIVISILSLIFMYLYFYCYYGINEIIQTILLNSANFTVNPQDPSYILYLFGTIGTGNIKATVVVFLITLILLFIIIMLMSKSFHKTISNANINVKKKRKYLSYKKNFKNILLRRELKHFLSSNAYMLNCGMATIIMFGIGIYILISKDTFLSILNLIKLDNLPLLIALFMGPIISQSNSLTSPSISLEGKNLWIIKSLPICTWDIFSSKIVLHLILTLPGLIFFEVLICICFKLSLGITILILISNINFVILNAMFGLVMSLIFANFNWINETSVIKQNTGVLLSLFIPWVYVILFVAITIYLSNFGLMYVEILMYLLVTLGLNIYLYFYLKKKGVEIFENFS